MIGNAGLTDGVVNELDRALTDHELVKVSARVGERTARETAGGTRGGPHSERIKDGLHGGEVPIAHGSGRNGVH